MVDVTTRPAPLTDDFFASDTGVVLRFPVAPRPKPAAYLKRDAHDSTQVFVASPLNASDIARIETIRAFTPTTLLHSVAELEQACLLIASEQNASLERYAMALIASLSTFAKQRLTFHAPGCPDYSDAEIWLSRVLGAYAMADFGQGRALVCWRVVPIGQRRVRFLASGLADAFCAREATMPL